MNLKATATPFFKNLQKFTDHFSETWTFNVTLNFSTKHITRTMCDICSKLTIKTPEHVNDVVLVSLVWTLTRFHILFWCIHCKLWISKYRLGCVLKSLVRKTRYWKINIKPYENLLKQDHFSLPFCTLEHKINSIKNDGRKKNKKRELMTCLTL